MTSEFFRTALGPLPAAVNTQVVGQASVAAPFAAPGQEDAPVMPPPAKPASKPASKKRKSTEDHVPVAEVDLDSIDVEGLPMENCDQVRRKINRFIDSGAMTKTAFARELGVSAKSLNNFLGTHGPFNGAGCAAYDAAWAFFKKRELAGIKMPVKKQKVSAAAEGNQKSAAAGGASLDLSDIVLPGEEDDAVPVFDTCDEIRKKINAHFKKPGVTKAQFCRDIYAQLKGPCRPAKPFQSSQLDRFRGGKGPLKGAKSPLFYGAYVFFEKMRIKEGKPKSKHRQDMEVLWGPEGGLPRHHDQDEPRVDFVVVSFAGFSLITCASASIICRAGERPYFDQYGKLGFC